MYMPVGRSLGECTTASIGPSDCVVPRRHGNEQWNKRTIPRSHLEQSRELGVSGMFVFLNTVVGI